MFQCWACSCGNNFDFSGGIVLCARSPNLNSSSGPEMAHRTLGNLLNGSHLAHFPDRNKAVGRFLLWHKTRSPGLCRECPRFLWHFLYHSGDNGLECRLCHMYHSSGWGSDQLALEERSAHCHLAGIRLLSSSDCDLWHRSRFCLGRYNSKQQDLRKKH